MTTQQGPPQYRKIAPVKKRPADGAAGAGAAGGSSLLGDLTRPAGGRNSGTASGRMSSHSVGLVFPCLPFHMGNDMSFASMPHAA